MVADSNLVGKSPPGRSRLLLVSADPALVEVTGTAARRMSAWLEVMPTRDAAFAWLLHPAPTCTHVLAPADLTQSDVDNLAGMVDEATGGRAKVFLLGPPAAERGAVGDGSSVIHIDPYDAGGIEQVLRNHPPAANAARRSLSAAALRTALHDGRLRVRFQPVLETNSLRMSGVEALSRLHHPELGILRPAQFMPQAIRTGQERALSVTAAARAVMDLRGQSFMQARYIAFNVPLPTFLNEAGHARALDICAIAGHPVDRVVIELVETQDAPDLLALAAAVERWRKVGFRVTVDDAGPRLPHWRDMLNLPFSGVKLDGSLAAADDAAVAEAEAIVAIAKRNDQYVVAEGIENADAVERMRSLGVDALQGFYFCRPMPAPALRIWAEAWETLIGAGGV